MTAPRGLSVPLGAALPSEKRPSARDDQPMSTACGEAVAAGSPRANVPDRRPPLAGTEEPVRPASAYAFELVKQECTSLVLAWEVDRIEHRLTT